MWRDMSILFCILVNIEEDETMDEWQFLWILISTIVIVILMCALLFFSGFRLGKVESSDLSGETYFVSE